MVKIGGKNFVLNNNKFSGGKAFSGSKVNSTSHPYYKQVENIVRDDKTLYKGAIKDTLSQGKNNLKNGYGSGSWGGVAKHLGKNMAQGAVAGGAVGGTVNYAQGGSFWDGAVSGAVRGSVGYGAYRTGLGAAGVKGNQLNVIKGVRQASSNANSMYHSKALNKVGVGVKEHLGLQSNVQISKQVMRDARKNAR